jgi:hypothetical protein
MEGAGTNRLGPLTLILLVAAAMALVACGGGGGGDDDEDEPTVEEVEETPTEEAAATTATINQDFWHAGWKVTLEDAALSTDEFGAATVTINATFENLGETDSSFNSQLALTSGGNSYTSDDFNSELPTVPAGLTNDGVFAFTVDEQFSFDDATLTVGAPEGNQAVVPLGANSPDELVTLEPQVIAVNGSATAGPIAFTVTEAEIRADRPDWSDQVEAGKLAMTVRFEVTPGAGIEIGEGVLQSQNVALMQPDGTALAVLDDGRSGVNELLQGREGTTISDLSARFLIDAPAEGDYVFIIRGPYGPDRAEVEGQVIITVPAAASGSQTAEPATTATP